MGSRGMLRGPRWLRGAFRGSERVIRYVKWIPWGHGIGLMGFLMNHEAYMPVYDSFSDVGGSRVWWRADFQSGSRVLKKVF